MVQAHWMRRRRNSRASKHRSTSWLLSCSSTVASTRREYNVPILQVHHWGAQFTFRRIQSSPHIGAGSLTLYRCKATTHLPETTKDAKPDDPVYHTESYHSHRSHCQVISIIADYKAAGHIRSASTALPPFVFRLQPRPIRVLRTLSLNSHRERHSGPSQAILRAPEASLVGQWCL